MAAGVSVCSLARVIRTGLGCLQLSGAWQIWDYLLPSKAECWIARLVVAKEYSHMMAHFTTILLSEIPVPIVVRQELPVEIFRDLYMFIAPQY